MTGSEPVAPGATLRTLLVSDLVGSTRLIEEIGDQRAAELSARHDRLARDLLAARGGLEVDKTDGFLLLFERPIQAVDYALAYHRALGELSREEHVPLRARVGIHLGEVFVHENPADDVSRGAKPLEVEGLAKPMAARVMSLAAGGQTLLTRSAFDLARRAAVGIDALSNDLVWLAHGDYLIAGVDEAVPIFEVGRLEQAPLEAPPDSKKVKRANRGDAILGWRPAGGLAIRGRPNWLLDEKVGEGGFGEVWLARHAKTGERRVFKFCFDAERLRALQREITVFRLLKEELGEREDIARILDWNFEQAPFYIESEYTAGGSLIDWAQAQGGLSEIPLPDRLEIVAQAAEGLAAAHSVGVLHRDVKPGNLLIHVDRQDQVQARLCDFGMGVLTDEERLESVGITVLGMTRARGETRTTSGTVLYTAPELAEGKPASIQADIYSLGVVLYQLVVGDLFQALGPGWERRVNDELLREDIAAAVDVNPKRRLASALELTERLRSLEQRRADRRAAELAAEERKRAAAALERSRKRQRVARLSAAVGTVAAALISLGVAKYVVDVRSERNEAQQARVEAEEVSDFLVRVFSAADPWETRGGDLRLREVLDAASERLSGELEDVPGARARLLSIVGTVYAKQGNRDLAEPLLEEAIELQREAGEAARLELARSLFSQAVWIVMEPERRHELLSEALAIQEEELGEDHLEVSVTLFNLAADGSERSAVERQETLERAYEIASRVSVENDVVDWRGRPYSQVAPIVQVNLGWLHVTEGRVDQGRTTLEQAAQSFLELPQGDSHPRFATALALLAELDSRAGDLSSARSRLEQALEIREQVFGAGHSEYRGTLGPLAAVRLAQGEPEAALELMEEGQFPGPLATVLEGLGRWERARDVLARAMEDQLEASGNMDPLATWAGLWLARAFGRTGDLDGLRQLLRRSLAVAESEFGEDAPQLVPILVAHAFALGEAGDLQTSNSLSDRADRISTSHSLRLDSIDWMPPPGWYPSGQAFADYEFGVDEDVAAYVRAKLENPGGFATLMTGPVSTWHYDGRRVRLSVSLRTEDVQKYAGVWLRIDRLGTGTPGQFPPTTMVVLDNMSDRPITGTRDWSRYQIVLDVPEDAWSMSYGLNLEGPGVVFAKDFDFDIVGPEVATTVPARGSSNDEPKSAAVGPEEP